MNKSSGLKITYIKNRFYQGKATAAKYLKLKKPTRRIEAMQ